MNLSAREPSLFRRLLSDLEGPIVYAMTIVASMIGILVWGATKLGRTGHGGLFGQFRDVFGTEYGLLFAALIFGLFAINRRWKAVVVLGAIYLLMIGLELNPMRGVPGSLDEYFALSAMMSSVIMSGLVYYRVFDD